MFESAYEAAIVITTIIVGWGGWCAFILLVNKMHRRADIRHTEARAQLDAKSNTARIITEKTRRSELLGSVNQHKHKFRLHSSTDTSFIFMCNEDTGGWGRNLRCGETISITKNDFWGDPNSTKQLFAKAVRAMREYAEVSK